MIKVYSLIHEANPQSRPLVITIFTRAVCLKNSFIPNFITKLNLNKTGVINDPLGQPTVPAGSDCPLILKFWDGRTDRRAYVQTDGHSVWK